MANEAHKVKSSCASRALKGLATLYKLNVK